MDILTVSVAVIAICMVIISIAIIATSIVLIQLIRKTQNIIEKTDEEVSPAIH